MDRFLPAEIRTRHDDHSRWNRRVGVYLRPAGGTFEVVGIERESDPPAIGMWLPARGILLASPTLSARDAIHVAVMRQHGVEEILSFDRAFDDVRDIRRIAG